MNKQDERPAILVLTPKLKVAWSEIQTPGAPFKAGGTPEYNLTLLYDPNNPEHKAQLAQFKKLWNDGRNYFGADIETNTPPWKKDENKDGTFTGLIRLRVKQKSQITRRKDNKDIDLTVDVVDAHRNPISDEPAPGSIVRASFKMYTYHEAGKYGVSSYLYGVQVLDLVRSDRDHGFDVEDGYVTDAPSAVFSQPASVSSEEPVTELTGDSYLNVGDDDLPF